MLAEEVAVVLYVEGTVVFIFRRKWRTMENGNIYLLKIHKTVPRVQNIINSVIIIVTDNMMLTTEAWVSPA